MARSRNEYIFWFSLTLFTVKTEGHLTVTYINDDMKCKARVMSILTMKKASETHVPYSLPRIIPGDATALF